MRDFLNRHSYLIIWILALVIIGAAALAIFDLNGYIPSVPLPGSQNGNPGGASVATPAGVPAVPPVPVITFTIQKSSAGNSFVVQWQNLPGGTTALNIFRGKTGTDPGTWSLWKSIILTPDELTGGSADLSLGKDTEAGYSFYTEAVGGGGNTDASSTPDDTVLWISSSTIPTITTSTPPSGSPEDQNPPPDNNLPPANGTSSSPNEPGEGEPTSTASGTGTGGSPQGPTGIPYYNPQVQVTAYGTAPGSFWVQHVNQSIEIGWQNLPSNIDTIIVARSASSTDPWNTFLIQHNPGSTGSYSIGIIDDTVNEPYYYELSAFEGTTTIATYGPAYLDPNG